MVEQQVPQGAHALRRLPGPRLPPGVLDVHGDNYCIATLLALLFAVAGPIVLAIAGPGRAVETIAVICAVAFLTLLSFYGLAVFVPGLAVTVRRLHDTGRSGLWVLVSFIPFIGGIVLLVLLLLGGTWGPNRYGPDPGSALGPCGPRSGGYPGGQPPAVRTPRSCDSPT